MVARQHVRSGSYLPDCGQSPRCVAKRARSILSPQPRSPSFSRNSRRHGLQGPLAEQARSSRLTEERGDDETAIACGAGLQSAMLFLVISTPRPERPSQLARARQSFWPWIQKYQACGVCRQVYARVGRGAVAVVDVDGNEALHKFLNEWADIIPAHFDTYPLVDVQQARELLGSQTTNAKGG